MANFEFAAGDYSKGKSNAYYFFAILIIETRANYMILVKGKYIVLISFVATKLKMT